MVIFVLKNIFSPFFFTQKEKEKHSTLKPGKEEKKEDTFNPVKEQEDKREQELFPYTTKEENVYSIFKEEGEKGGVAFSLFLSSFFLPFLPSFFLR